MSITTAQYFDKRSSEWEELYARDPRFARRFELLSAFIDKTTMRDVKSALDYGCGTGLYSRLIANRASRVTALDISPDMLKRARALTNSTAVTYQLASKTAVTQNAPYDLAISLSVIEYAEDWRELLEVIASSLTQGGVFIVSIPNPSGGVRRLESIALHAKQLTNGKLFGSRGEYLAHQRWGVTPREFDAFMQRLGLYKRDELWYNSAFNMPKKLLPIFEKPWWAALYAGAYEKI